jgi:hypothetical protein
MRNTCYLNSMCFLHSFLIALIKKNVILTYLKDTCPFYMWVVGNFLQTSLYEISVQTFLDESYQNLEQFVSIFPPMVVGYKSSFRKVFVLKVKGRMG